MCLTNTSLNDYNQYKVILNEETINASFGWLDSEKQDFLLSKYELAQCEYKFYFNIKEGMTYATADY